jgi:hypothetical protein
MSNVEEEPPDLVKGDYTTDLNINKVTHDKVKRVMKGGFKQ